MTEGFEIFLGIWFGAPIAVRPGERAGPWTAATARRKPGTLLATQRALAEAAPCPAPPSLAFCDTGLRRSLRCMPSSPASTWWRTALP